jgi:type II secretory pathway pseudopilin PulG
MKYILVLAICFTVALPALCQSPAPNEQQEKEQQLRLALQQMRDAIDHYHGMFIRGKIMAPVGSQGYPNRRFPWSDDSFLPKVPVDPMTGTTDWSVKHVGNQQ